MKIYADIKSGNCYKIALLCAFLKIPHQWIHVDIMQGDAQKTAFLNKNCNGKIPLLELDEGQYLAESNAILNYLAHDSQFIPSDNLQRALVLQWQFFEQYSHEPFIAVARFINVYLGLPDDRAQEYQDLQTGGHKALSVMEQRLIQSEYLVGSTPTIADISLYAYTHVAEQGGFELSAYPGILTWIKRIQQLPGYKSMDEIVVNV